MEREIPRRRDLEAELAEIDAKLDAWADAADSADACPPDELLRRKFEVHQLLNGGINGTADFEN